MQLVSTVLIKGDFTAFQIFYIFVNIIIIDSPNSLQSLWTFYYYYLAGVVLPAGPVARGHPNGRRASQSHILAGPVGQP